jgi:hypothetical protein
MQNENHSADQDEICTTYYVGEMNKRAQNDLNHPQIHEI